MSWRYGYKPYVPVAKRRAQAAKEVASRLKKGQAITPIVIEGRNIVSTFWGKAWCTNLESYSDYANRLPRGRTYVRNGSVVDLKIEKGQIHALVSGSELYSVRIEIAALPQKTWQGVKKECAGKIGSLVELLQGKLSNAVMAAVTDRDQGLFPKPKEIKMRCSCPDYAGMCKHIAAVMYGIGNRLDSAPELLFELRGVDSKELIEQAIPTAPSQAKRGAPTIETSELSAIFDIEISESPVAEPPSSTPKAKPSKSPKLKPQVPAESKSAKSAKSKQASTAKPTAVKKTATVKQAAAKKTTAATTTANAPTEKKPKTIVKQAAEKKAAAATTTAKKAVEKHPMSAKNAKAKIIAMVRKNAEKEMATTETVAEQKTATVKKRTATQKQAATGSKKKKT